MIWILLLILAALGVAAYLGGRTLARRRSVGAKPHSRPGQHGAYALIWVAAPEALVRAITDRRSTASGKLRAPRPPPE